MEFDRIPPRTIIAAIDGTRALGGDVIVPA
jgi:hypothetical protein